MILHFKPDFLKVAMWLNEFLFLLVFSLQQRADLRNLKKNL